MTEKIKEKNIKIVLPYLYYIYYFNKFIHRLNFFIIINTLTNKLFIQVLCYYYMIYAIKAQTIIAFFITVLFVYVYT